MPTPSASFDEMSGLDGRILPHYQPYAEWQQGRSTEYLAQKRNEADAMFRRAGITFAVYGEESGTERLIPFDLVPRILPAFCATSTTSRRSSTKGSFRRAKCWRTRSTGP